MSAASDEKPQPPANAYHVMADLLGEDYFAAPPPSAGVLMYVTGSDQRQTQWAVSGADATDLFRRARSRGMHVRTEPYPRGR